MSEIRIQLTECVLILNVEDGIGDAVFEPSQFTMADDDDQRQKWNDWNTALDTFMSFCLKMAIAGIDLTTPQFVAVINEQFDYIADQYGDQADDDYLYLMGDEDDDDDED